MKTRYTRKQLASHAEIGVEAVRFYEKLGLIPTPERSPAGYRLYDDADIARVRYVKRAQELGFSLNQIKDLVQLTSSPKSSRAELRARASEKAAEIRAKISDLKKMASVLDHLIGQCDGKGKVVGCPIFEFMTEKKTVTRRVS